MVVLVGFIAFIALSWDSLQVSPEGKESGSTTLRNIGLITAAIIALPLAIRRSKVAERQATAAQDQAELNARGLLQERYQKGAEMLGSDVLAVRLGGIYALERLAAYHRDQYYIEVMKLFCAFVRNPPQDNIVESRGSEPDGQLTSDVLQIYRSRRLREDVQAAITAIGKRNEAGLRLESEQQFQLDLRVADLRNEVLTDANLPGSFVLRVGADLTNALLLETDLSGADMRGTILHDTKLSGARMRATQLGDADLTGAKFNSMGLAARPRII